MKNIFQYIQNNKYTPWFAFAAMGLLAALSSCQNETVKDQTPTHQEFNESADTFIPRGYVLVPLDLRNAESLTGIVGDLGGVVDVYTVANESERSKKVASKVKLLRAPLNPQQFAVLLKESESTKFLNHAGPFVATIQNPQEKSGPQVSQSVVPQIQYLGD